MYIFYPYFFGDQRDCSASGHAIIFFLLPHLTTVSPPEFCMASHTSGTGSGHLTTPDLHPPPLARLEILPQQQQQPMPPSASETDESLDSIPSYLVISGGTGCNAICTAFAHACYVLPVSDDGGSSSEIVRVLGGPSIGR
jgi:hypothetical protein